MRESHLPPRDREMAMLRIGWLNNCEYEFAHHKPLGREAGLTAEDFRAICIGPGADRWSTFDKALLRAVDEMKYDAQLSDEVYDTLAKTYDENQMVDLVMTVGNYNMVSTGMNIFGLQLEPGFPGFPEDLKPS